MIRHAQQVAQYVWDSDCEKEGYQEHIKNGNNPEDHILYSAAVVLGLTYEFKKDIERYYDLQLQNRIIQRNLHLDKAE